MRALPLLLTGVVLAPLCGPSGALAQSPDHCSEFKWSIARERKAFSGSDLPVVHSGGQYPGVLGGVTVALDPQSSISYPQPPARPPKANPAYGAVLTAPPIAAEGLYQVTLSDEAWVDLVQNGVKMRSEAFSGKAGCPEVHKSVRFRLKPGPLTIEVSDSAKPTLKMDVLPAE